MADVDQQIATQMTTVNGAITEALSRMNDVYADLEDSAGIMPIFIYPSVPVLPVNPITVGAVAPAASDIDAAISAINTDALEPFSPSHAEVKIDGIDKSYLNWIPKIEDFSKEEDKMLGLYSSDLLNSITNKLKHDIENGGTGLSPEIQQAAINLQSERDAQIWRDARDKVLSVWSTQGFEIPDNVLQAQIQDLIAKEANLKADRSREILIKTFDMADANTKWSVEQGIALEGKLMEMFNALAERIIKYVLGKVELSSAIFKALVEASQAEATLLLTTKQIENEAQKIELEAWKGKLDYYKTKADVGLGRVDAIIKKYGVEINRYVADAGISEAQGRINLEQSQRDAQNILLVWKAGLEAMQQNLVQSTDIVKLKTAASQGTAQILSNYVAAMANSINSVLHLSSSQTQDVTPIA